MAPISGTPDNPDGHYDGGSPLDGGGSPSTNLGGSSGSYAPTGLEIGVIVGVIALVIISIVVLFIWRTRRARAAKNLDASATDAGNDEDLVAINPTGAAGNHKSSSTKRSSRRHPVADWDHWSQPPPRNHAEEYEITNRF
ncbi:hypothetical protein F5X99DRAFT_231712 [Biscogniauxia marginata]|nr:hypothetical protein F5X99DRAFT_231712 [Biscogniauxia marginata]